MHIQAVANVPVAHIVNIQPVKGGLNGRFFSVYFARLRHKKGINCQKN
jgi:hypothetical protein